MDLIAKNFLVFRFMRHLILIKSLGQCFSRFLRLVWALFSICYAGWDSQTFQQFVFSEPSYQVLHVFAHSFTVSGRNAKSIFGLKSVYSKIKCRFTKFVAFPNLNTSFVIFHFQSKSLMLLLMSSALQQWISGLISVPTLQRHFLSFRNIVFSWNLSDWMKRLLASALGNSRVLMSG